MLISLCDQYINSDNKVDIRDLAIILTCNTGFLRFDEVSRLRCNDVVFEDEHFNLNIRSSKTDQFRSGNTVVVAKGQSSACAYSMLSRYISMSNIYILSNDFYLNLWSSQKKM